MHTIAFNERCLGWTENMETNKFYLIHNFHYLSELFSARGYLYLNQIFEQIGAPWNPDWENVCFRSKIDFAYDIQYIEDADFMITIHS